MIVVHHLNDSRSQRILWLLEELGIPYEIKHYQRDAITNLAPPSLLEVHPLGKSPVITDGDLTIAESAVIVDYLISRYGKGKFAPAAGSPEQLRYNFWMHYAEGSAMPPLLMALVLNVISGPKVPFFIRPIAKMLVKSFKDGFLDKTTKTHFDFVESELAKSTWFVGEELTGADIMMSFPLEVLYSNGSLGSMRPRSHAFVERIIARPAYQRALAKGGPYKFSEIATTPHR